MAHDDLDFLLDDDVEESSLPKKLRAKIDELSSKLKELSEENATLKTGQRKANLNQILQDNGFSPKIANFMPTDLELNEDAIKAWLDENGDVFSGARLSSADVETRQTSAPPTAPDSQVRMEMAEIGPESTITVPADLEARIAGAKSMDELMAVLRSA
jgi:hypothetical protein